MDTLLNPPTTPAYVEFPVQRGSKGAVVKNIQLAINRYHAPSPLLVIDGDWGQKTDFEVKKLIKSGVIYENDYTQLITGKL